MQTHDDVISFWFNDIDPAQWWLKDKHFDHRLGEGFSSLHGQACMGELFHWRDTPLGWLAEIIVLDQFSRSIYRDSAKAFAHDGMALILSQEAIRSGADQSLTPLQRSFLYMPYMHSESPAIHRIAEVLFKDNGIADNHEFELKHKAIIDRFGRYPHRNAVLGRESTSQELAFLQESGSSF